MNFFPHKFRSHFGKLFLRDKPWNPDAKIVGCVQLRGVCLPGGVCLGEAAYLGGVCLGGKHYFPPTSFAGGIGMKVKCTVYFRLLIKIIYICMWPSFVSIFCIHFQVS